MSDTKKILESYAELIRQYGIMLPDANYYSVRDTLIEATPMAMLIPHCVICAYGMYKYTDGKHGFLKSIVLTFLVSFGGAIINAVLTATPSPVASTDANSLVPTFLLVWWLTNCFPAVRALVGFKPIHAAVAFVANFAKIRAISTTVESVAAKTPNGWVASIILGGIGGCGGMLFLDADKKFRTGPQAKSIFTHPPWGFKAAFLCSFLYYVLTDPHGLLDIPKLDHYDIRFVMATFLGTLDAFEILAGRHIHVFYYAERTLIKVLGLDLEKQASEIEKQPVQAVPSTKKTQ